MRRPPRDRAAARGNRRGQALVEFAIILPLLLLVLTGILQFGVLLSGQIAFVNAVREAARYGSVLQTASPAAVTADGGAVVTQLQTVLEKGLPGYDASRLSGAQACYLGYQNPNSAPATYSVELTLSANYSHPLFVPIIAQILDALDGSVDGGFRLHASERFRVENPPLTTNPLSSTQCAT
jgi:Flp pilus assembly protein TadG